MAEPTDALAALEPVYANTERILGAVRPGELGAPTPCPSYDVRDVANHLLATMEVFRAGLEGETRTVDDVAGDLVGDDPGAAFGRAARSNLAAWRARPGVLDETLETAFGTMPASIMVHLNLGDALLHGWDVAVATGQDPALPEEPAAVMLAFMQGMLLPSMRSAEPDATFGPEVSVPPDAPVVDRLLGFSGRDPGWRP